MDDGVNYTFEQLRSFLVLSEELHFGRAAARLSITQPPLTRQIRKLERSLGAELFFRHRNGVELSPAGREFREGAYSIMSAARSAQERTTARARSTSVTVRVGFTGLGAVLVLPVLLSSLARNHPDIRVRVTETISPEQYDLLARGDLDLGVVRPSRTATGVRSHRMCEEPLVVAVPRGQAPAHPGPISPEELRDIPMIAFDRQRSPLLARFTDEWAERYSLEIGAKVSQVLPGVSLAASGLGFALAPASVTTLDFADVDYRRILDPGAGRGGHEQPPMAPVVPLTIAEAPGCTNPAVAVVRRALVQIGREMSEAIAA